MLRRFDVCVLGGGPAGLAAALRAVDFGKSVCLIEKNRIGGADLWQGALQSKTMWEMSKQVSRLTGSTARRLLDLKDLPPIDSEDIKDAITQAAEARERQILHQLGTAKVEVIRGAGGFLNPNAVEVITTRSQRQHIIEADYFVIATGSSPRQLPQLKEDKEVVLSSDTIMTKPFPKSMLIIGAGVIGCEFASIYSNFGQTTVHVIEKSSRILPNEDADISKFIEDRLVRKGVQFHHHVSLHEAKVVDNHCAFFLKNNNSGDISEHHVEKALVSIGRVPNYGPLNLNNIPDITYNRGKLQRDGFYRLKPYKHIYACGDTATNIALVNVGEIEARNAVEHMYSTKPESDLIVTLDNLTTIMFLDQEVAAVGLNEQECRRRSIAYKVARYSFAFVSRAVAMNNTRGFVKLIVTNDRHMTVLGVRVVGPHASSIVELASLAIHNKESAYALKDQLAAYPAITQGFQECLRMLLGVSVIKPHHFPEELLVTEWNPPNFERGRAYQAGQ